MARVAPYHTDSPKFSSQEQGIYHDAAFCAYGKKIQDKDRLEGTAGKQHCMLCDKAPDQE